MMGSGEGSLVLQLVLGVVALGLLSGVRAQGRMLDPPGRSSLWRFGFATPVNHHDNSLSCGGVQHQWTKAGGRCGVCGDPWDSEPRDHEAGGKFASGIIAKEYISGELMTVTIDVSIANGGYFEFRLCPNDDIKTAVSDLCLEEGLLPVVTDTGTSFKYQDVKTGENLVQIQLPPGLVCSQCVLQWKYTTGDHYGCEIDTAGNEVCCFGCGEIQTLYYACADIAIYSNATNAFNEHNADKQTGAMLKRTDGENTVLKRAKRRVMGRGMPRPFMQTASTFMRNPFTDQSTVSSQQLASPYASARVRISNGFSPRTVIAVPTVEPIRWSWNSQLTRNGARRMSGSGTNAYSGNIVRITGSSSAANGGKTRGRSLASKLGVIVPQASLIRVTEPERARIFRQVDTTHVQQTFVSPEGEPKLALHKINQRVTAKHVGASGACKAVGPFRSTGMDDWCNSKCATGSCVINKCACPGKTTLPVDTCNNCPFGVCWDDKKSPLDDLYPGLFVNPLQFLQCAELDKLFTLGSFKVISEGLPDCEHPRIRRQALPIQMDDDDVGCCATRLQVIMPLTVESENDTYRVVHLPNDQQQILVQGICRRNTTVSCPVCSPEYNFQWVLVYDVRAKRSPPVSFVPVRFPHYCRCRNPGRRTLG